MWDLAGSKGPRVKDGKSLPMNLYIGHFLKPYFKDKVTGVVSPSTPQPVPSSCVFRVMVSHVLAPSGPGQKGRASSWEGPASCSADQPRTGLQG